MAELDPEKEVEKRGKALVKYVTDGLKKYYKGTGETEQIELLLGTSKDTKSRTPEEQANKVLDNVAWTCNSAHMVKAGRDTVLHFGGNGVKNLKELYNSKDKKVLAAYAEFRKLFIAAMKKEDLVNFEGDPKFAETSWDWPAVENLIQML